MSRNDHEDLFKHFASVVVKLSEIILQGRAREKTASTACHHLTGLGLDDFHSRLKIIMVCVQERSVSQKPCTKPTTENNKRAVLLGWLLKYEEQSDDFLRPHAVLEYSQLARIASRSIRDKGFLRNRVYTLCSCVRQGEFLDRNSPLLSTEPSRTSGCNLIRKYDFEVQDAGATRCRRVWKLSAGPIRCGWI